MTDIILVAVLLIIIGLAALYIVKAKKSGHKCIGCPNGCCSAQKCGSACCGCKQEP